MDVVDDAEGPLDPRIQIELENLNNATDDINKLETELDEARTAFNQLLSEFKKRLKDVIDKIGDSCVEKARCYYEALDVARQARVQCQQQAQLFQRASEIHAAAKETVAVAEARFMSHQHEWNFDQAWQDMLNHATIKVMDAENQKAECAREHHRRAVLFHDAEKKVQRLEEKYRRSIMKARPYFEFRFHCDQMLATQKERVEYLQKSVKEAKKNYALSLRALEEISNQIHQQRRDYAIVVNGPREPGVGAELDSPAESLNYENELNKIHITRMNSVGSSKPDTEDGTQDFENDYDPKVCMENLGGRSVDGSESTSNQWELELQASLEKLNSLSLGQSITEIVENNRNNISEQKPQDKSSPTFSEGRYHISNKIGSVLPDPSMCNAENSKQTLTNNTSAIQGWQSLTHSPINSILNKSKIVLRNNLSKSLNASPVNIGFSFRKWKLTDNVPNKSSSHTLTDQECKQSTNTTTSDSLRNSDKTETSNEEVSSSCVEHTIEINRIPQSVPKSSEKDLSGTNDIRKVSHTKLQEKGSECKNRQYMSHSVSVSPAKLKLKELRPVKSLENALDSQEDFEPKIESTSDTRELPLLSLFGMPSTLESKKAKSCSMINLNDKQSLKALLGNSELSNIQAISVEKLASVRHNLIAGSSKVKA